MRFPALITTPMTGATRIKNKILRGFVSFSSPLSSSLSLSLSSSPFARPLLSHLSFCFIFFRENAIALM